MRKLVVGCAMAGLMFISAKSEAKSPADRQPSAPQPSKATVKPRDQVGLASWYGVERQGKPTASGQLFDRNKLTAAHRELPFGTRVRVTNLGNHLSTLLMINDRGPGIKGRMIDVSEAAARRLGFTAEGLARVRIDVVSYPQICSLAVQASAHSLN